MLTQTMAELLLVILIGAAAKILEHARKKELKEFMEFE